MEINECRNHFISDLRGSFNEETWENFQRPVMEMILQDGSNVLGLLPTGYGKSRLYQVLAAHDHDAGVVLVIEPLTAIIEDQIRSFNKCYSASAGIRAVRLGEFINLYSEDIGIVYISPEELFAESEEILQLIKEGISIQMIAVDEVHTLFDWGATFRKEFMFIPMFINKVRSNQKDHVTKTLYLTATLSRIQLDICCAVFNIKENSIVMKRNTNKINIFVDRNIRLNTDYLLNNIFLDFSKDYSVYYFKTYDEMYRFRYKIIDLVLEIQNGEKEDQLKIEGWDIPWCGVKNSDGERILDADRELIRETVEVGNKIYVKIDVFSLKDGDRSKSDRPIIRELDFYRFSGNMDTTEKGDLIAILQSERRGTGIRSGYVYSKIISATKSFGMGVNVGRINEVVIVGMPESWNDFRQEAGRIRNKGTCRCLYSRKDSIEMLHTFLKQAEAQEDLQDDYVTVVNRIKLWEFLSLWEWILLSDEERKIKTEPENTLSLEELLNKKSKDVKRKLDRISDRDIELEGKEDSKKIKGYIESSRQLIDVLFRKNITGDFLSQNSKLMPWFIVNNSPELFSNSKKSIFNLNNDLDRETITVNGHKCHLQMPDGRLDFFDFMVFNALYTCKLNYVDIKDIPDTVHDFILGFLDVEKCTGLMQMIEESIIRLSSSSLRESGYLTSKEIRLYDNVNGTFPFFEDKRFAKLKENTLYISNAEITRAFNCISRRTRITCENILAVHYTLFGIEKARNGYRDIEYVKNEKGKKITLNLNNKVARIPYNSDSLINAINRIPGITNIPRSRKLIRERMQRILVCLYNHEMDVIKYKNSDKFFKRNLDSLKIRRELLDQYPDNEVIEKIYELTVKGGYGLIKDPNKTDLNEIINNDIKNNLVINTWLLDRPQRILNMREKKKNENDDQGG